MILTKKKLRKEIENSPLPQDMYQAVFDHITSTKGRLMWETELLRMTLVPKGELKEYLEAAPEGQTEHNDIHSDDHLHHTHNDDHAI